MGLCMQVRRICPVSGKRVPLSPYLFASVYIFFFSLLPSSYLFFWYYLCSFFFIMSSFLMPYHKIMEIPQLPISYVNGAFV